jgi:hypothetical protein
MDVSSYENSPEIDTLLLKPYAEPMMSPLPPQLHEPINFGRIPQQAQVLISKSKLNMTTTTLPPLNLQLLNESLGLPIGETFFGNNGMDEDDKEAVEESVSPSISENVNSKIPNSLIITRIKRATRSRESRANAKAKYGPRHTHNE